MKVQKVSIKYFSEKIDKNEVYSFSRFGDGEWHAMLGKPGVNCDGHKYFKEMGHDLRQAVRNPLSYIYGLQNMSRRTMQDRIKPLLKPGYKYKWINSDVFHYASWHGNLAPMVIALKRKKVCLVGPKRLNCKRLKFLTTGGHIIIPLKDCYSYKKQIKKQMIAFAKKHVVFCLCASMLSEVLIHELYNSIGKTCWIIDFGSVWDPYSGNLSRRYHRHITKEICRKNLYGDM